MHICFNESINKSSSLLLFSWHHWFSPARCPAARHSCPALYPLSCIEAAYTQSWRRFALLKIPHCVTDTWARKSSFFYIYFYFWRAHGGQDEYTWHRRPKENHGRHDNYPVEIDPRDTCVLHLPGSIRRHRSPSSATCGRLSRAMAHSLARRQTKLMNVYTLFWGTWARFSSFSLFGCAWAALRSKKGTCQVKARKT